MLNFLKRKQALSGIQSSLGIVLNHTLSIFGEQSVRQQSHSFASTSSRSDVADGPVGHSQVKAKLYDRGRGGAAHSGRPRLMGGDPLMKIRLAQKLEQGIPDDRGYEQDNTPKKLRKAKPPRGHPDRKPRHANNPRRVPDMFRITHWRQLIDLVDHHHDFLDWKKLMAFLGRTTAFYRVLPKAQKDELRSSGLMERMRDRAEELDIRQADRQFLTMFTRSCKRVHWDAGEATKLRIKTRLAQLEEFEREAEALGRDTLLRNMENDRRKHLDERMQTARKNFRYPSETDDDVW